MTSPALPRTFARRQGATTQALQRESVFAFLLILPTILVVVAVIGYPLVYSLWTSLNSVDIFSNTWTFVGLDNYVSVLPRAEFRDAFVRTLYFATVTVVGGLLLGMGMALVLNAEFAGRGLIRSILLLPWATPPVIVGLLWLWIYDSQNGVLNGVLYAFGFIRDYIAWLADGAVALNLVAWAYLWTATPLVTLLLLAGLQTVPHNLYSAAKVDGANGLQRFWSITVPWLKPMLLILSILTTINGIMHFDLIYVITKGGPARATEVFSWLGYETTFAFWKFGEGAAILYTLSLVCLVLAVIYIRALHRQEDRSNAPLGQSAVSDAIPRLATVQLAIARNRSADKKAWTKRYWVKPTVKRRLLGGGLYLLAILIALWALLPFLWLVISSLSLPVNLLNRPPSFIPSPVTWEGYEKIFSRELGSQGYAGVVESAKIPVTMLNSLTVAAGVTVVSLFIGSHAGYAFARYQHYSLMSPIMLVLLATRMIPGLTLLIPMFVTFRTFGLLDTKVGLVIAYTAFVLPLIVWILKGYFETIPANMERAALVDGCTRLESFYRIVIPVAIPGLVAAGILAFLVAWNDLIFALLLTKTTSSQTVQIVLVGLSDNLRFLQREWNTIYAACVVAALPPVLLAFIFQRYLIRGLLSGATKG